MDELIYVIAGKEDSLVMTHCRDLLSLFDLTSLRSCKEAVLPDRKGYRALAEEDAVPRPVQSPQIEMIEVALLGEIDDVFSARRDGWTPLVSRALTDAPPRRAVGPHAGEQDRHQHQAADEHRRRQGEQPPRQRLV